jgi:hypothetical protein
MSTCADAEAPIATTGANGNPVPNADQQVDGEFAQIAISRVK